MLKINVLLPVITYVLLVSKDTLQVSGEYIQTSENSNGFAYPLYDKKKLKRGLSIIPI